MKKWVITDRGYNEKCYIPILMRISTDWTFKELSYRLFDLFATSFLASFDYKPFDEY